VSLPDGIARHGLFIESSRTEFGRRWFARSKIQRLDHVHSITFGSRKKIVYMLGVGFVVRRGPERDVDNANIVAGIKVVLISLFVMRYAVCKWCNIDLGGS